MTRCRGHQQRRSDEVGHSCSDDIVFMPSCNCSFLTILDRRDSVTVGSCGLTPQSPNRSQRVRRSPTLTEALINNEAVSIMKIICVGLGGGRRSEDGLSDGWVTLGKEYVVLGVYGRPTEIKYRILSDDGQTPALHTAEHFKIVSPAIPADWIFSIYPDAEWKITPAGLSGDDFWTAYFDGDAVAEAAFEQVAQALGARR